MALAACGPWVSTNAQALPGNTDIANRPVWAERAVKQEPLLFIKDRFGRSKASLLHIPRADPQIFSSDRLVKYVSGADYIWRRGSNTVFLTKNSRIPSFSNKDLHPAAPGPYAIGADPSHKDGFLMFSGGAYFYSIQVFADYPVGRGWGGPVPLSKSRLLPKTNAALAAHSPIHLVVLGDSISAGSSASSIVDFPPHRPPFAKQVADGLQTLGAGSVSLTNLSVGGKSSDWGLAQLPAVLAEKPGLLIIAFGMNDAVKGDQGAYLKNISSLVSEVTASLPDCEILMVSPMRGNREWRVLHQKAFDEYPGLLQTLERQHVAVANVTAEWDWIEGRKGFLSMTGNGVNHPNDFGHKIYADTILATISGSAR